ncbi:MAG: hypothetical protein U0X20_02990 [Caldilineaceae bacterium]
MKSRTLPAWIGLLALAGTLAGCRPIAPVSSAAPTPAAGELRPLAPLTQSVESVITQEGTVDTGAGINNPLVKQALLDLSKRLGIGPDAITLVSAESVVWPDGSLGCPRPDMGYKQVQQDGMRIIFKAQGRTFEYHSGGSRPPFLCESPAPTPSGTPSPGEGT